MEKQKKSLTDKAGIVRELMDEDFAQSVSFQELPTALQEGFHLLKKRGRPKVDHPKQVKSFKLSADVIAGITASGKGYNARVDAALRHALEEGRI